MLATVVFLAALTSAVPASAVSMYEDLDPIEQGTATSSAIADSETAHFCDGTKCAGFVQTDVQTRSATGCNGRVCITLTGSGLTVDTWKTTAWRSSTDPTTCNATAYFKSKGPTASIYYTIDLVVIPGCRSEAGYYYAYFENGASATFVDGTRVGNAWDPNSVLVGFPTELIHD